MKNEYTDKFETFWSAYPRKVAKFPAFKAWIKNGIEDDAFLPTQIVQDLEKRTRFKYWSTDHEKIPHAQTWLNARRWEDEGWQDEIKSREPKRGEHKPSPVHYKPIEDTGPQLSEWERVLNVFWLKYVRHAKGIMPEQVTQALRIKHAVLKETESAIIEEIENDPDKRGEMVEMIVKLFLSRLDLGLQMKVSKQVVTV
jgi:hypothetical protein